MSIRVTCPNCKTAAACPDEYQGKSLRCKKCGRPFVARARRSGPPSHLRRRPLSPAASEATVCSWLPSCWPRCSALASPCRPIFSLRKRNRPTTLRRVQRPRGLRTRAGMAIPRLGRQRARRPGRIRPIPGYHHSRSRRRSSGRISLLRMGDSVCAFQESRKSPLLPAPAAGACRCSPAHSREQWAVEVFGSSLPARTSKAERRPMRPASSRRGRPSPEPTGQ